jgi:CheY-like chemotaxis protein
MNTNLRILLLEDNLADAKLIERELFRNGFNFSLTRAQTEVEIRDELAAAPPDLVLSNHCLAQLGGFEALTIVHDLCPTVPFIFVSGSMDQELVHDMYEEGASDYVFKRELNELASVVARATGVQPGPAAAAPYRDRDTPPADMLPQLCFPTSGVLLLCPRCHQARDESGQVVPLEDYCYHRLKSLVVRKVCQNCSRTALDAAATSGLAPFKLQSEEN